MQDIKTETKRECLSCEKFFDCKHKEAKKEGCIFYQEREKPKNIWDRLLDKLGE